MCAVFFCLFAGFRHTPTSIRTSLLWRADYNVWHKRPHNTPLTQWEDIEKKLFQSNRLTKVKSAIRLSGLCSCFKCTAEHARACCIHAPACSPGAVVVSGISGGVEGVLPPVKETAIHRHAALREESIKDAHVLCYHYRYKSIDDVHAKCNPDSRFETYKSKNCAATVLNHSKELSAILDTTLSLKVLCNRTLC